mmetsp:Transcript_148682/g.477440  ORF Transcript_148682/g.477440 Transcript_148682/m.477440 type:complete len:264 (-) Transcript_148682:1543-2334(-)
MLLRTVRPPSGQPTEEGILLPLFLRGHLPGRLIAVAPPAPGGGCNLVQRGVVPVVAEARLVRIPEGWQPHHVPRRLSFLNFFQVVLDVPLLVVRQPAVEGVVSPDLQVLRLIIQVAVRQHATASGSPGQGGVAARGRVAQHWLQRRLVLRAVQLPTPTVEGVILPHTFVDLLLVRVVVGCLLVVVLPQPAGPRLRGAHEAPLLADRRLLELGLRGGEGLGPEVVEGGQRHIIRRLLLALRRQWASLLPALRHAGPAPSHLVGG